LAILVNPVLNLLWAINIFLFRETIYEHLTIVFSIISYTHPSNHILSLFRRIRHHKDKFFFIMFWQFHRNIIWFHFNILIKVLFGRELPEVFTIIEDF